MLTDLASLIQIIQIPKKSLNNEATLGDKVSGVVKKSKKKGKGRIYKKTVVKIFILKLKRIINRKNGWSLKFNSNSSLLLNNKNDMIGSKINTVIPKECLIFKKTSKIRDRLKIFKLMNRFYI